MPPRFRCRRKRGGLSNPTGMAAPALAQLSWPRPGVTDDNPAVTDVFLSYSRRDLAFVRQVVAELTRHELTVWVDWEGIAPTTAWLTEIQRAIETADHFLFVISPDSIASEICALELSHAVERHKRLIPLIYKPVTPESLPGALRETHWFALGDAEPMTEAMQRLATVIRTDPATVRKHTRLLTAAIEWQSRLRERSLLLRGKDLLEAEQWLLSNPQHPAPTALHREFVAESRRLARLQRRILAGGALTIGIALAVLGVNYLSERRNAKVQALAALSRATAAQAIAEQEQAYDLALLLAVEAYAISPTLEAEGALQRILSFKPRLERILPTPNAETVGLGFSQDGARLAAGFGDGSMRIWSLREQGNPVGFDPDMAAPAAAYAFNPDLSLAAAGGAQRDAIALRGTHDRTLQHLTPARGHYAVQELRFSPDGRWLASANGNQPDGVSLWQTGSQQPLQPLFTSDGGLAAVAFSPDGTLLAAGGWSDYVSVWQINSGHLLQRRKLPSGGLTGGIALAADWLAAASADVQLFALSQADAGPALRFKPAAGAARGIALDKRGQRLAVGSEGGKVQVWDLTRAEPLEERLDSPGSYVDELVFSPDGSQLATGGYGQPVRVYNMNGIARFGRIVGKQTQAIAAVGISPDGKQFAAAGRERIVDLWSPADGRHERLAGHLSDIGALAFSADGSRLISADARLLPNVTARSDRLRWDLRSSPARLESPPPEPLPLQGILAMFPDLPALRDTPWPIVLDDTGDRLAQPARSLFGYANIELISSANGRRLATVESQFGRSILALALSADGSRLAAGTADGHYAVWTADNAKVLFAGSSEQKTSCAAIALSRDGRHMAVACGNELAVFDVDNGTRLLSAMQSQTGSIAALAFAPGGRRLAAADSASGWSLWDIASARTVGTGFNAGGAIAAMAFSADGRLLLSGDRNGQVVAWDVAVDTWRQTACRIAGRELTPDERQRYLPGRAHRPTCLDLAAPPSKPAD